MVTRDDLIVVKMNDLHYRAHEMRNHLMQGDTLLLTHYRKPVAIIRPLSKSARTPRDVVVRSITYVNRHRREFSMELVEGTRIVFIYKGKKIALVDPDIPDHLL